MLPLPGYIEQLSFPHRTHTLNLITQLWFSRKGIVQDSILQPRPQSPFINVFFPVLISNLPSLYFSITHFTSFESSRTFSLLLLRAFLFIVYFVRHQFLTFSPSKILEVGAICLCCGQSYLFGKCCCFGSCRVFCLSLGFVFVCWLFRLFSFPLLLVKVVVVIVY